MTMGGPPTKCVNIESCKRRRRHQKRVHLRNLHGKTDAIATDRETILCLLKINRFENRLCGKLKWFWTTAEAARICKMRRRAIERLYLAHNEDPGGIIYNKNTKVLYYDYE